MIPLSAGWSPSELTAAFELCLLSGVWKPEEGAEERVPKVGRKEWSW